MKKLSLILIVLLSSFSTSAQGYNLNNYKYRYQQYKSLSFDYNLNGNKNSYSDIKNLDLNKFFSFKISAFYNKYSRTDKKQKMEYWGFRFSNQTENILKNGPNYDNNIIAKNRKQFESQNVIYYQKEITKYKKNYFLRLNYGNDLSTNFSRAVYTNNSFKNDTTYYDIRPNLSFGVGKGRIEIVDDAVTAIFLLKDLVKNGVIVSYTKDQVETIAKGITEIRNRRIIGDNRFKYIDQIAAMDSVCKASGIANKESIKYISTLYDNLLFAKNSYSFNRKSGSEISSVFVSDGFIKNWAYVPKALWSNINCGLKVDYEKYKQINKNVEGSFKTGLEYNLEFLSNAYKYYDLSLNLKRLEWKINYGMIYQPNSRTNFQVNTSYKKMFYFIENDENISGHSYGYNLYMERFLSRKLSINARVNQSLIKQKNILGKETQFYINSGLAYTLF